MPVCLATRSVKLINMASAVRHFVVFFVESMIKIFAFAMQKVDMADAALIM